MTKRKMYKVHKWIAVTVGVFFLVWLISGIAMVLPNSWYTPVPQRRPGPIDFKEVTVSPAEAIATLARLLGSYPEVNSVNLKRIRERAVYQISVKRGDLHLIDARSGEVFKITQELAEQIARDEFPLEARVLQIDLVTRNSFSYPWGSVPAYEVVFDDNQATMSHVAVSGGTVRRSTRWSRIQAAVVSLHTFEPLKLITKRKAARKGLLLLLSLLGIAVAGTGYYLSIPRRRVRRQESVTDTVIPQDVPIQVLSRSMLDDKAVTPSPQRSK